jgi:hypothetical protein
MARIQPSPAALWASAFALMGLIVLQASRMTGGEAHADIVSSTGALTALTFEAANEDILCVLDGRTESLFVYRPDRRSLELIQTYKLPDLFADARAGAGGTR